MQTLYGDRKRCYSCYRPESSCMCKYVHKVDTNTKFVILMHPKEFKKVKNGTGHLTHLSLNNSELFVGIDFTNHKEIDSIITTYQSYILYPSIDAINISKENLQNDSLDVKKNIAIFIIDSTWACSLKMLRESKNLRALKHISFESTKLSEFRIKEQPREHCLSTIESTLSVLELLHKSKIENLSKNDFGKFLNPFYKMVEYQIGCIDDSHSSSVRFKHRNSL